MSQSFDPHDGSEGVKPGMSGTTKLLLILLICFIVIVVLCCGGVALIGMWGVSMAKDAMSKDPEVIHRVTGEIVEITIPASFEPEMSMDMKIPFNQGAMQLVQYTDKAGGELMLQQMSTPDPNARAQFEAQMNQQRQFQPETITVETTEPPVDTEINGSPAHFTVAQGKGRGGKDEYWTVEGTFEGKSGPGTLRFRVKSDNFTKDQVLELLKSMK